MNVPGTTTRTAAAAGRAEMQEQVIDLLRTVARSLRRQHARLAANGERAVRKDPDQHDNRLVLLTITPAGHRRAAEWSAASRQAIGRLLRPLPSC